MSTMKKQLYDFWVKSEQKIVLAIGLILIAIIAFEAGFLQGQKYQQKPLIIEKPAITPAEAQNALNDPSQASNLAPEAKIAPTSTNAQPKNCAFVGSKNSNKYHLPACHFAKLIKPENLVCFASTQDAVAKNYQPDKGCIK